MPRAAPVTSTVRPGSSSRLRLIAAPHGAGRGGRAGCGSSAALLVLAGGRRDLLGRGPGVARARANLPGRPSATSYAVTIFDATVAAVPSGGPMAAHDRLH